MCRVRAAGIVLPATIALCAAIHHVLYRVIKSVGCFCRPESFDGRMCTVMQVGGLRCISVQAAKLISECRGLMRRMGCTVGRRIFHGHGVTCQAAQGQQYHHEQGKQTTHTYE